MEEDKHSANEEELGLLQGKAVSRALEALKTNVDTASARNKSGEERSLDRPGDMSGHGGCVKPRGRCEKGAKNGARDWRRQPTIG